MYDKSRFGYQICIAIVKCSPRFFPIQKYISCASDLFSNLNKECLLAKLSPKGGCTTIGIVHINALCCILLHQRSKGYAKYTHQESERDIMASYVCIWTALNGLRNLKKKLWIVSGFVSCVLYFTHIANHERCPLLEMKMIPHLIFTMKTIEREFKYDPNVIRYMSHEQYAGTMRTIFEPNNMLT